MTKKSIQKVAEAVAASAHDNAICSVRELGWTGQADCHPDYEDIFRASVDGLADCADLRDYGANVEGGRDDRRAVRLAAYSML